MRFDRRYALYQLAIIPVLIVLDQLSKYLALQLPSSASGIKILGFSLIPPIKNYNLIFGWDMGFDLLNFNILLTALFCVFLFYYVLSLIFIPKNFYYLQTGISILFASFASNFGNKIINGYVLDFIRWSPFSSFNAYFNLADTFQTVAWLFILSQFIISRKSIWKADEKRKQFLVMRTYQLQFVGYCALIFSCMSFFFIILNYQFLNIASGIESYSQGAITKSFLGYSVFILFLLCLSITIFSIYISNKIYGPLYAFEKYVKALINGEKPKDLRLRKNDQLKHLEELALDIKRKMDKSQ